MKTVREHYDCHLGPIYLWSVGGAEAAFAFARSELKALHLPAGPNVRILDLGAGFGAHAIPLALDGTQVTAVDVSAELLESLRGHAAGLPVQTVPTDLLEFLRGNHEEYDAILCMGDTLTHLANADEVDALLGLARKSLVPGGKLILTFRDYTQGLSGEQRFIPVRADETRILTCFLEYQEQTVSVHDIVHEKTLTGWHMTVSAYRKLRLSPLLLLDALQRHGFDARREEGLRGMVRIVAARLDATGVSILRESALQTSHVD